MVVVDTSAWLELFQDSPSGKRVRPHIPEREDCIVPTLVQLELAKWLHRECDEDTAYRVIAYTELCRVVPLDTRLALLAAEIHGQYKLATADAIVYATAHAHNAKVVTCNAHFESLPNVIYIAKIKN